MQRWNCAVGAIVVLALAGGSVAACSKGGNNKQNAAQAKAKPKADPKAAKADPKAAKPAQTAANTQPAAKPAQGTAPATKPATTAAAQKAAPAPAQKPAPAAPAVNERSEAKAKPAQTAANTQPAAKTPQGAAPATKPVASAAAQKPATTPAQKPAPAPVVEQTTASTELQANKTLIAQLQSRLPAGTDVVKASMGFRNLTQFVSAVHASHNLSIPFDKMRTAMVDEKKSLSAAIRVLKPTASATIEAQRADYDARGMIHQAQHTETPATDSPAKKAKPSTSSGVER